MPTCDNCHIRPGKLVMQVAHGPCGRYGEVPRFVFRYYLCPYCLGVHNRAAEKGVFRRLKYIQYKFDHEVLQEDIGKRSY